MLSEKDKNEIKNHGLTIEEVERQIDLINKGVKFPELIGPAKINDGIKSFTEGEAKHIIENWEQNSKEINIVKFIPASGAATRMFKSLNFIKHNFKSLTLNEIKTRSTENSELKKSEIFFENIEKFPFAENIPKNLLRLDKNENILPLVNYILGDAGLNLANSPKGLIYFHKYDNSIATPIDEHVFEALNLFGNSDSIKLHFTISPKFENKFKKIFDHLQNKFYDKNLKIDYSFQHPSTDTIVFDNGRILRDNNGGIVFRPGGHGALLKNLNEIDADLIFIKNIDNISRRDILSKSVEYKKMLAGYALSLVSKIHRYLDLLDKNPTRKLLDEISAFIKTEFHLEISEYIRTNENQKIVKTLHAILNRPLRVVAMVKNTGEPGGGPFWVRDNGRASLQIIEKSQIDVSNTNQLKILNNSTHFNPVDLVCYVKDYKGQKFDLTKFVNNNYGIITKKHLFGKDVKVLELPGLWNASMWNWNTIFIDVPLFTFTPVKEITDLLKKEHLGYKLNL